MRESPYAGPPGTNIDLVWQALLADMSIRVTKEELDQQGQESVPLEGGGYLAWLGVFHQLHCTISGHPWLLGAANTKEQKMLRQLNYRNTYHPNITRSQSGDWQVHADHCIEILRASAMCRPDLASLTTFIWDEKTSRPMLRNERPTQKCVDWQSLTACLRDRAVDERELRSLS